MKIGTRITLEVIEPTNEINKYQCKVIDNMNNYIIIDYPVNVKSNKTTFLPIKTKLKVIYNDKKAVYQFNSIIAKKLKAKIPALAIPYPDKGEIKRIQRRRFVRINTSLDVAIHSNNNLFESFTSVTIDISGGGMSVLVKDPETVTVGDSVHIYLVLPFSEGHYYIIVEGEIVSVKSQDKINIASLKFLDITNKDQQQIIRYCFEKEREQKNKELF